VSQRPRLLFISPRFLFPTDEGGKIRTASILRGMKGGEFHLTLATPAPSGFQAHQAELDLVCDSLLTWPTPPVAKWRRVLALAGRLPVGVASDRSATGSQVVARALADAPDVVVADFPHATVLLPEAVRVPSVMFTHNVEAEIFERHASLNKGLWGAVWRNQARKMADFEGQALRRFDTVIAVSQRDATALGKRFGLARLATIDTGVDLEFFRFSPPSDMAAPAPDGGTIGFTGVLDSPANIDGVDFLMREVWPLVARARPAARALMIGRRPAPALVEFAREKNLPFTFTGFVDDIRPHVHQAHLMVIPLRVGSGTRIKAFEAMAMGRPVVSTRIGIEGLDIDAGAHFLAADSASDFAAAILGLLDDATLRTRLAEAARARLEERFGWAQVARQFEAICQAAIAARHTTQ